jgi:peptidoglycan-associated lipoprotein
MRILPLALILTVLMGLSSCGSSKKKNANDGSQNTSMDAPNEDIERAANAGSSNLSVNSDSDSGKAGPLQTVNFDFNSATLRGDAKRKLQANAAFLKSNSNVQVQVEGHCDERGGVQFNLALGEQRAKNVRSYLISQGVKRSQLSTISFGKERPLAFGHDESSWRLNRRANFVVTAK